MRLLLGAVVAFSLTVTIAGCSSPGGSGNNGSGGASGGSGGGAAAMGGVGGTASGGAGGASSTGGVLGNGGAGKGGVGGSGAGGTSGQGGAAAGGSAGAMAASGCAQDLTGTWDLLAESGVRGPRSGVLVISSTTLSLQVGAKLLYSAQPAPRATWQSFDSNKIRTITISNTPVVVDSGSVPLALGGSWMFAVGDEQCTATVAAGLLTGRCDGSGDYAGGADWPEDVATLNNGRIYTATRTSAAASQFGEFGGTWQTTASSGSGGSCTITLAGNQVTTQCSDIHPFNGTMHLTIGSDCVASGMTGNVSSGFGYAISGQRR